MPITFSTHPSDGYFLVTYVGRIRDDDLIPAFEAFFDSADWVPGLNELADIRDADLSEITSEGMRKIGTYITRVYREHNVSVKSAIFAPTALGYGLARMYEALTDDSPQRTQVFDNLEAAVGWLTGKETPAASFD